MKWMYFISLQTSDSVVDSRVLILSHWWSGADAKTDSEELRSQVGGGTYHGRSEWPQHTVLQWRDLPPQISFINLTRLININYLNIDILQQACTLDWYTPVNKNNSLTNCLKIFGWSVGVCLECLLPWYHKYTPHTHWSPAEQHDLCWMMMIQIIDVNQKL